MADLTGKPGIRPQPGDFYTTKEIPFQLAAGENPDFIRIPLSAGILEALAAGQAVYLYTPPPFMSINGVPQATSATVTKLVPEGSEDEPGFAATSLTITATELEPAANLPAGAGHDS